MKERIEGMKQAYRLVVKLGEELVGATQKDGTRNPQLYQMGVGCERAAMVLKQTIELMEKGIENDNKQY